MFDKFTKNEKLLYALLLDTSNKVIHVHTKQAVKLDYDAVLRYVLGEKDDLVIVCPNTLYFSYYKDCRKKLDDGKYDDNKTYVFLTYYSKRYELPKNFILLKCNNTSGIDVPKYSFNQKDSYKDYSIFYNIFLRKQKLKTLLSK